jgi:hypothetical protein
MRIAGRRSDGALHLVLGGGLSVILRASLASPPTAEEQAAKMGPWYPADDSLAARQQTAKRLNVARVVPVHNLSMSFDEIRERVVAALRAMLGMPNYGIGSPYPSTMDLWIPQNGLGDDWVVYTVYVPSGSKNYVVGYSIAPSGDVTFEDTPEEVVQSWETLAEKAAGDYADATALSKRQTSWWKEFKASRAASAKLSLKPADYGATARALMAESASAKHLAYDGPHPFSYCINTVVPAMEQDGKGPDDPEAFCAWWKGERKD